MRFGGIVGFSIDHSSHAAGRSVGRSVGRLVASIDPSSLAYRCWLVLHWHCEPECQTDQIQWSSRAEQASFLNLCRPFDQFIVHFCNAAMLCLPPLLTPRRAAPHTSLPSVDDRSINQSETAGATAAAGHCGLLYRATAAAAQIGRAEHLSR